MHFEILVEDASGKIALEHILEKILGPEGKPHTRRLISYKGIGRLPKNLKGKIDPQKRILLDRLPQILRGYGKSLTKDSFVIVLVDLDDRDCKEFKKELLELLVRCNPVPQTLFRIAIEELEAWYFGDREALLSAYPNANKSILEHYQQDSICGTWERLADALYPGGSQALKNAGWPSPGQEKCKWAEKISPLMNIEKNKSKSFQVFRDGLRALMLQEAKYITHGESR
jgi:hypothetical protein